MNRIKGPLAQLLRSVEKQQSFPLKQLKEYMSKKKPTKIDCTAMFTHQISLFEKNCLQYRNAAVAVWLCASMGVDETIQQSLDFFGCLARSRLLLLIFDDQGNFVLDKVLLYLSVPMQAAVRSALQKGKTDKLEKIIKYLNCSTSKYNEILFLLQLTLIRKTQKYLQEDSLQQFNFFLKQTLHKNKYKRVTEKREELKFRMTVLLRKQEQSADTFHLQMKKNGKLAKHLEKGQLPYWVMEAYVKPPQGMNLAPFRSRRVTDVFVFLSQAQVFASSPLVQEVDSLACDDHFIQIFQHFLMGTPMSSESYNYGCKSIHQTARELRQRLTHQNEAYHSAIAHEALNDFK